MFLFSPFLLHKKVPNYTLWYSCFFCLIYPLAFRYNEYVDGPCMRHLSLLIPSSSPVADMEEYILISGSMRLSPTFSYPHRSYWCTARSLLRVQWWQPRRSQATQRLPSMWNSSGSGYFMSKNLALRAEVWISSVRSSFVQVQSPSCFWLLQIPCRS